ncbi:MAG TPA: alpha/beta fold hydrolase [Fulvivirga sp.]|nr:alpha/beta fold hydrolase [Fulvivirga sp.]
MKYLPPKFYFNPHIETIIPALFRRVKEMPYQRERINTPDDDFLDIDWLKQNTDKLVILSHGLEGNSQKPYMRGMAKAFFDQGYDVAAWNFRGCSGEMNKQLRFYHSGATDDLETVVKYAQSLNYKSINLIGFSLGGNITLKYLGEKDNQAQINRAVAISVPLDLHTSCQKISQRENWVYANRFLNGLKSKVRQKAIIMPGRISSKGLSKLKTLIDFDDAYTAPLHGFDSAIDYYTKCSSLYFLKHITTPTLILNALNDPFLTKECYPIEEMKDHENVILETPDFGGHVGFTAFNKQKLYWSEKKALDFIMDK